MGFDEECKASFQLLKLALVEATTLQFPDPDVMFHVHTDSSNIGIGAVLSQDGKAGLGLRHVAYTSWELTDVEKKYPSHEQELLAIIHALKEWRHWLIAVWFG